MPYKYIVQETGGPKVLKKVKYDLRPLKEDEVLIRQNYIGLNHIDALYRSGQIVTKSPFVPGYEATGLVEEKGPKASEYSVGTTVGYAISPIGAYCTHRIINKKYLYKIPKNMDEQLMAASMLKLLIAHTLCRRAYIVCPSSFVMVNCATGGIGHLLAQFIAAHKSVAIGTVGSDEKIAHAKKTGCFAAFNYNDPDLKNKILKLTNNKGVCAVMDPLGPKLYKKSLECLGAYGIFINYGNICGHIKNISTLDLVKKSNYVTRPSVFHYKEEKRERDTVTQQIQQLLTQKFIKPIINKIYKFDEIPQAHTDMLNNRLMFSNIVQIDHKT